MSEAGPRDPARQDPAFFSLEFLQQIGVFEINEIDLVFAEKKDEKSSDKKSSFSDSQTDPESRDEDINNNKEDKTL